MKKCSAEEARPCPVAKAGLTLCAVLFHVDCCRLLCVAQVQQMAYSKSSTYRCIGETWMKEFLRLNDEVICDSMRSCNLCQLSAPAQGWREGVLAYFLKPTLLPAGVWIFSLYFSSSLSYRSFGEQGQGQGGCWCLMAPKCTPPLNYPCAISQSWAVQHG